jgi:Ca2+-transporting ATPase
MSNQGLSTIDALSKLKEVGFNELVEKKVGGPLTVFLRQFANFLVFLLVIAAVLSFFLGDATDGIFILFIVIFNSALGFVQEIKAERAIEALRKVTISKVRVLRDENEAEIDSRYLVPGDVFFVEEGTKIPADGQIIESHNLEIDESSLTGESLPIVKGVESADPANRLFSGTVAAKGRGKILVTETGMQTKFGKIAEGLQNIVNEDTPLQKKITSLGKQLGAAGVASSILVFVLAYLRGTPPFDSVLTSVSLAVAAIPEGLPAVITITLAIGVQRMSRAKAVVRKMTAVESLGSTSVIAADKTGTLTTNQMRVREIWFDGSYHLLSKLKGDNAEPTLEKIVHISSICNNASLVFKHDHGSTDILGDTTEGSLLLMVHGLGLDPRKIKDGERMVAEFPFDSASKTMSAAYIHGNQTEILTKGAPESILKICTDILLDGKVEALSEEKKELVERAFEKSAATGLRMIAFSFKDLPCVNEKLDRLTAESKMVFIGFVGIADPPRVEAKAAVELCKEAGIRVVMVTGDNELTANAIGSELGIIEEGGDIVTGAQLENYSDKELSEILPKVRIFARTTPEHKYRIVKSLQGLGEIVAVTGDGVNDALALKQADVGVAMGKTGTDVAKEAADIVITDDNFASIVRAVEEGRVIFENVKSAVKFLIGCNAGEVLAVLIGILLGWPLVLTPFQLLYINLITDGLPAVILALTPKHPDIMKAKPKKNEEIVAKGDLAWLFEISAITTTITLIAFFVGLKLNLAVARTMALTTLVFSQNLVLLDIWSRGKSAFNIYLLKNPNFLGALVFPFLIQFFIIYNSTFANIFKITQLNFGQLGLVMGLSVVPLIISEARKFLVHKRFVRS